MNAIAVRGRNISKILVAAALLLAPAVGEAAELTPLSVHDVRLVNGEPAEPDEGPISVSSPATGTGVIVQQHVIEVDHPPTEMEPHDVASIAVSTIQYLIEPEGTESVGDCVIVDFSYLASGELTVTGSADGRFGIGGGEATAEADPPSVVIDEPSEIVLHTPAEELQFSYGPDVRGPDDPDLDFADTGFFMARIGDEVELQLTTAAATFVPPGDSASLNLRGELAAAVREGVIECPPASVLEIPTLGSPGMLLLILVLGGVGVLALRLTF